MISRLHCLFSAQIRFWRQIPYLSHDLSFRAQIFTAYIVANSGGKYLIWRLVYLTPAQIIFTAPKFHIYRPNYLFPPISQFFYSGDIE